MLNALLAAMLLTYLLAPNFARAAPRPACDWVPLSCADDANGAGE